MGLTGKFFWALQGIESDHQGTFPPEQGILLWPTIGHLPRTARSGCQSGMRRYRRMGKGREPPACLHTRAPRAAGDAIGWLGLGCEVVALQRGPRACSQGGPILIPLRELTGSFLGLTGNETTLRGSSGQIGENLEPMMCRSTWSFAGVERCRSAQSQKLLEFV